MSTSSHKDSRATVHASAEVAQWLQKAVGDLKTAEREFGVDTDPNFDAVCFHAQQGAEKLMKAALVARGCRPPKVHDLVHLAALLDRHVAGWEFSIEDLSELSSAAVEARYPGSGTTRTDAGKALATAGRLWSALRPLV